MFKKIGSILLLLFWMGVIFAFSAQPAEESDETSDKVEGVVMTVLQAIWPDFEDSELAQNIVENLTTLVRKGAHFTIYMILGILSLFVFWAYKVQKMAWLYALGFSLLYAISDEIHQTFVDGRAGRATDVLIDMAGAIVGILLVSFCVSIARRRKINKKELTN